MDKTFIINVTEHETRVALLEDGNIAEIFIERQDDSDIAGNIYKGRVQRVLPGMQAAFVDIGLTQAAFIHVSDLFGDRPEEIERILLQSENGLNGVNAPSDDALTAEKEGSIADSFGKRSRGILIEETISEGQELMVYVAKSPLGTKGARVSSHISLPGRLLVLMPFSNHIGISRRIESEAERQRLKDILQRLKADRYGYIVRTAAEEITEEKLVYEMKFLKNLWENIQRTYRTASAPSLLHRELTVSLRAVRDLMTQEVEQIVIDSRPVYTAMLDFLDTYMPTLKGAVRLYDGAEPIFDAYNIEGDISRALKKKIWLKSGGYIVIEHTEALVAIDVNTGRYVGQHNLEETIVKTNLEAVREIAYQIRLRDIGGIIIIDFIDMEKKTNQERVFHALEAAMQKDRSRTNILPISEMGIVQMTRKRVRKSIGRMLCEACFYCEGEGHLLSRKTICYNIYREVLRVMLDFQGVKIALHVHPWVAELLHGEEKEIILRLEERIGTPIDIYPSERMHLEQFKVLEVMVG